MARGMYRGGHAQPTFITKVEFIPINQTASDRSSGYRDPEYALGEWTAQTPVVEDLKNRDDFSAASRPRRGMVATTQGVIMWDCIIPPSRRGCRFYHVLIEQSGDLYFRNRRTGVDEYPTQIDNDSFVAGFPTNFYDKLTDLNIARGEDLRVRIVDIGNSPYATDKGFPPISRPAGDNYVGNAGVMDDAAGQTFMWPFGSNSAQQFHRSWSDGNEEAFTLTADVKDVQGRESMIGAVQVATITKSLIFAKPALSRLLDSQGPELTKNWKLRIGNQDLDIVSVMTDWDPGKFTRIVAEARS